MYLHVLYSLKLEELLYDVYNDANVVWNIRAQTFYIVNNVFCGYPSTCDNTPLLYYSNATLFLKATLITPYSVSTYRQIWWWALCVVCILRSLTHFICHFISHVTQHGLLQKQLFLNLKWGSLMPSFKSDA